MSASEIVFEVTEDEMDGGYSASALGYGIHTQGDSMEEIRRNVKEAVDCYFDETMAKPGIIRLRFVPRRTPAHRKRSGGQLSSAQSDRLARVDRVVASAEEAIGDGARAARWLRKPSRALQGRRPLDLLASDVGARLVEQELGRIEHGLGA